MLLSSIIFIILHSLYFTELEKSGRGYNEWLGYPPWYQWHEYEIDRDTSNNIVVYEIIDNGNCGELGFCPALEEYK